MTDKTYNKNILIAVDESENSRRAVDYVGQMLGGLPGFKATILHVIPDPDEDYFPSSAERENWLEAYKKQTENKLQEYRGILLAYGFASEDVRVKSALRYCPSMAECILSERDESQYDTIVVGRHGLSRKEQFLFGSVSSKIVNHASNCTVWVVA